MTTAERSTPVCIPLESGDRLTRAEFERRYSARPDIKKAELIEGVVYVASPVRTTEHGQPHFDLTGWLSAYVFRTPGIVRSIDGTVKLDADNELQPDLFLTWDESHGGKARLENGYLVGAPDLALEIAASSASHDLGTKMNVYRRNGLQEYMVWQILEGRIDWFQLVEGVYQPIAPNQDGIIESVVFPGLRLNVAAMLSGDLQAVMAALDQPSA